MHITSNLIFFTSMVLCLLTSSLADNNHLHTQASSTEPLTPSPSKSTFVANIIISHPIRVGERVNAILQLKKHDGCPVNENDLIEAHTEKLHLLIIEQSLTDYHHEHPTPTETPGEFAFSFTPQKPGTYRVWADVIPQLTQQQEYLITDIPSSTSAEPISDRKVNLTASVDGLSYTLTFDPPSLVAGKPALGKLIITSAKGKVFDQLEPIMGAYAHIVGFSEDLKSIAHIHPMGPEPTKSSDRGLGILEFHLEPEIPGLLRLFVQVQINGKNIFTPFTLKVNPK